MFQIGLRAGPSAGIYKIPLGAQFTNLSGPVRFADGSVNVMGKYVHLHAGPAAPSPDIWISAA